MKSIKYFWRRLHQSGLTWLMVVMLLLAALPSLFDPLPLSLPFDQPIFGNPLTHQYPLQRGFPQELRLPYRQTDYLRELTGYLAHLRQERSLWSPEDSDPVRRSYYNYLAEQESLHLARLNETYGSPGQEAYYYGRYAFAWAYDLFPWSQGEAKQVDLRALTFWEPALEQARLSADPVVHALGRNLENQLPLTLSGDSASPIFLGLLGLTRLWLIVLPLAAFFILAAPRDRNLREPGSRIPLRRSLAVFTASALLLLGQRGLTFLLLVLHHGDDQGGMYVATPWGQSIPGIFSVMTLRQSLLWISAADLAFLFLVSALAALFFELTRRAGHAVLVTAGCLILPTLVRPELQIGRLLGYTAWNIYPSNRSPGYPILPEEAMLWFAAGGLLCLALIPGLSRLRTIAENWYRTKSHSG